MSRFDLLTEPWVPVLDAGTDLRETPGAPVRHRLVGLREALVRAHEVREVYADSPLETVALNRLLLALLLDAALPGPDRDRWTALRGAGRLDAVALDGYLDGVRAEHGERFDLLDADRPFYQHPAPLARDATTLSQLFHAEASGNNGTLFGHEMDDPPRPDGEPARRLGLAEAARAVLAAQTYGLGGLAGSAAAGGRLAAFRHAPLVSGAVFWLRGDSLFDALLLNAPPDAEVWKVTRAEDKPAWRRGLPDPEPRRPEGLRDLLTWQARRITLVTETAPGGGVVATGVYLSNGESIEAEGVPDPMMAREESKKTGVYPLGLRSEKAVWRDADLLHTVTEPGARGAPSTFRALGALAYRGVVSSDEHPAWTADVFGVVNDKSKMLRWQHGRVPVYPAVLADERRLDALRDVIEDAGEQATGKRGLRPAVRTTAEYLLSPPLPGSDDRPNADTKAVTALAESLDAERRFWQSIETPFLDTLRQIAEADDLDAVRLGWARVLWDRAGRAFDDATSALDRSARHLQARARGLHALQPVPRLQNRDAEQRDAA